MPFELLRALFSNLPSIEEAQAKIAEEVVTEEEAPAAESTLEEEAAEEATEEAQEAGGAGAGEGEPETEEAAAFYDRITNEHLGEEVPQQDGETDEQYRIRMLERRADKAEFFNGVMMAEGKFDKRYPNTAEGVKHEFVDALLKNDIDKLFAMLDRAQKTADSEGAEEAGIGADVELEGESSSTEDAGGGGGLTELPTREGQFQRILRGLRGR